MAIPFHHLIFTDDPQTAIASIGLLQQVADGGKALDAERVIVSGDSTVHPLALRAKAEALIGQCKVGFMERPERIVLVLLGALFNRWGVMAPVLRVLAVLSTITVIHRVVYTYQNTKHLAPIG